MITMCICYVSRFNTTIIYLDVIDDCNDSVTNLVDIKAKAVKSIQSLSLKQKVICKKYSYYSEYTNY